MTSGERPSRDSGPRLLPALAAVAAAPIAVGALVIPPGFRGLLVDEYAYVLPSLSLAAGGPLRASATAIAPNLSTMVAGAGSAWLLGGGYWSVRFVAMIALWLAAIATGQMASRLGAPRGWALVAGLVVAAGPVTLPLGLIFMSDVPFAAMLAIGGYLSLRWWRDRRIGQALGIGLLSGVAATARPQGVLLAGGCVLATWVVRKARPASLKELAAFSLPIALAAGGLAVWLFRGAATNRSMALYTTEAFSPTLGSALKMIFLLPAFAWLYMALMILGPSLAAVAVARRTVGRLEGPARRNAVVFGALGPALVVVLGLAGRRMPYMAWGSMIASNGVGGGYRQEYPLGLWIVVTVVVAVASAGFGIAVAAGRPPAPAANPVTSEDKGERLLLVLAVLQLVGAAPLGLAFNDSRVGFDRYLIPVLVFLVPVVVARCHRLDARAPLAAVVTCVLAALVLVGAQDWMAQRTVSWQTAEALVASGVPLSELDAGFEWNATKMGESEPRDPPSPDADWQVTEFAPAIDPVWVIARDPRPGYEVVNRVRWSSWTRNGELLVMRRYRAPSE